ncbi:Ras-related GTP-binding protein D [Liparis tanakae]|uniref:Ras-related GTP-binding protein n=1 Tax=Liparis tanakae TaxID=230148 RepID=A0A4Z2E651_9TELE|nr:Ras-related GTP-binding protein D [Liparis tanakae]
MGSRDLLVAVSPLWLLLGLQLIDIVRDLSASRVLGFSDPLNGEVKPCILLMGLRRSGKSSIQKGVFHKMSPSETLFLESTNKICREDVSSSSFVSFQIWDFPGQINFFDPTFDYEMNSSHETITVICEKEV